MLHRNKIAKITLLCCTMLTAGFALGGCNSGDNETTAELERKMRAPKGPMPEEARKATAEALAKEQATQNPQR